MKNALLFRRLARVPLAAFVLALPAVSQAQSAYAIIDLGGFGGVESEGWGISNNGQVTGNSYTSGYTAQHAVMWTGTTIADLGTLGGASSYGFALNASGQVTGYSYITGNTARHAFRYSGSTMTDLGTLGGTYSEGVGINASGQVAGDADLSATGITHAVIWTGTTAQDLGTLGGLRSVAWSINDSGQVTGNSYITGSVSAHAFRYVGSTMTDLGTLGGTNSYGFAINASGQVAGQAYLAGDTMAYAVRWTGATPANLGTLGGSYSAGNAINASGDVVGFSQLVSGSQHAFLYSGGRMIDLNSLLPMGSGWELTTAQGINDKGWITGRGTINGHKHAFILKPNLYAMTGRIALEGVSDLSQISPAAPPGMFHISFRSPGTTTEVYSADVTLMTTPGSAFGTYSIASVPGGVYDVTIKGGKNLRVIIPNVSIGGNVTLPDVTLPAGDANNDNSVDIADFDPLVNAFGSAANDGTGFYDARADFNFDGAVDLADFGLLVGEYGNAGAL